MRLEEVDKIILSDKYTIDFVTWVKLGLYGIVDIRDSTHDSEKVRVFFDYSIMKSNFETNTIGHFVGKSYFLMLLGSFT